MEEIEIWRPIQSCSGYEASSLGRIRSTRWSINRFHRAMADAPRIKAQSINENGYCTLQVGHGKRRRVHVLVAEAFLGPKPPRMDVNHIDGNKANNRPDNLEYLSRSDNHRHAFKLGLSKSPFTGRMGAKHFMAKLTDRDVLALREDFSAGVSRRDLAIKYGISYYTVWDITTRRSWTHI